MFTLEISCKNEIALEETRTFTSHKSGAVLENWKVSCRKRRRNWGKSAILSLCHRELEIRSRKLREFPKRQGFERILKAGFLSLPDPDRYPPPLPPSFMTLESDKGGIMVVGFGPGILPPTPTPLFDAS